MKKFKVNTKTKTTAMGLVGIGAIQTVKAADPEAGQAIEESLKSFDWSELLQLIILLLTAVSQFIATQTDRMKAKRLERREAKNGL